MAPWWLRPTADGGDDTTEKEPSSRSGRRGRGRARSEAESSEPASLVEVVAHAAESPDESTPVVVKESADSDVGADDSATDDDGGPRKRSGRTRGRRSRAKAVDSEESSESATKDDEEAAKKEVKKEPKKEPKKEVKKEATERPRRTRSRRSRTEDTYEVPARGGSVAVPPQTEASREIVISIPDLRPSNEEERKLALFCDLENVARGARDTGKTFDINLVLERLVEKGKIIVRKAYCDWTRYADYKRPFHEAGIELIEIPQKRYSGKNSADIRMVVDAMDLSYSKEHLDTFVLLSGDSDFSPLVSKLKENNKYVIAVGVKGSTSKILIDACDEFIYYEDIWRDVEQKPEIGDLSGQQKDLSGKEQEMVSLIVDTMKALIRENKDVLWGSMIKQTIQRKRPSFNEGYYGYSTFSELLEACEAMGVLELQRDKRSGSYIVTNFAGGAGGRR